MTAVELVCLQDKYGGYWSRKGHTKYTVAAWQYAVAKDTTREGYWEWVYTQLERDENEIRSKSTADGV